MWLHGASRPTPDQQTFRTGIKAVPIYVSAIDDRRHLVTDLTRDDFQILDNGRPVDTAVFDNHVQRITGVLLLQALSWQFQREREAAPHSGNPCHLKIGFAAVRSAAKSPSVRC
jgi:hypothetical protein